MRSTSRWALSAIALLSIAACTLTAKKSNVADGDACEASNECASARCRLGYCAGRSCSASGAACEPGWQCVKYGGGLFSSPSSDCEPLCGKCPPSDHCPVGGTDGTTRCADGPPRRVTITGPDSVKIGSTQTFSVTIDPPLEGATVRWYLGERGAAKQGQEIGSQSTMTATFDGTLVGANLETELVIRAEATHFRQSDNVTESAEGERSLQMKCLAQGETCQVSGQSARVCCAAGLYCKETLPTSRTCAPN